MSSSNEEIEKDAPPRLFVSDKQAAFVQTHLQSLATQTRALVELSKFGESNASNSKTPEDYTRPLIENLRVYPHRVDLSNLVPFPPSMQPIAVKPLFFDLAWNYIDYAGHSPLAANGAPSSGSEIKPVEEKKEARRGWFGFGR